MSKEIKIKVAVQMDKLDKINKDTDSTLVLIQEAIKRKFSVYIYSVDNLYLENNELKAISNQVLSINIKKEKFLKYLNNTGVETRPILSGNFLNQQGCKLYNFKPWSKFK